MSKALIAGITQVASDKGLDKEVIFDAIEAALVSAYKRNYGAVSNVSAEVDRTSGEMRVFAEREVVEDVMNERTEIAFDDARKQEPGVELGDVIRVEMPAEEFGRIAAQTAKQVILQRIREAERDTVYENFAHKVGEILTAQVRSIDMTSGAVTLLLDDKHEILMMKEDQIGAEKLRRGDFLKVYVVDVHKSTRGPVIKLSRTHRNLLRRLMEQEIPEVRDGLVEIKAIAREPGARSKAAVIATVPNVDPVGSCVGQRGLRIQNIVNELAGEKIDVIEWHPENAQYISNALSPARVTSVLLDEKTNIKTAIVIVPDKQLSLAIGKEGQNARLAAKLTGWRIDIKSESEAASEGLDRLVAERAAARMASKQEDLLAVAERLLKGDDEPADDRLWAAAARALESSGPAGPEIAEQMMGADEGTKARKPKPKAQPEDEGIDSLVEGLPDDVATAFPTLGPVGALPAADLADAFQRSLQAVESTPEAQLPSEAPFSEEEVALPEPEKAPGDAPAQQPAPGGEVLPTVITGEMLRARMAQRKEADLRNIEIPKELLAGLENIDPQELERPVAKPKKPAAPARPAPKAKKKKWYPVDGGDDETVY
jgi:N utilization substance protein A